MRKKKIVKFSNVHSFEGLESLAIIVVDIEKMCEDRSQSLLYLSMSRATSLLVLMINKLSETRSIL